jgi:hypothetical protein
MRSRTRDLPARSLPPTPSPPKDYWDVIKYNVCRPVGSKMLVAWRPRCHCLDSTVQLSFNVKVSDFIRGFSEFTASDHWIQYWASSVQSVSQWRQSWHLAALLSVRVVPHLAAKVDGPVCLYTCCGKKSIGDDGWLSEDGVRKRARVSEDNVRQSMKLRSEAIHSWECCRTPPPPQSISESATEASPPHLKYDQMFLSNSALGD